LFETIHAVCIVVGLTKIPCSTEEDSVVWSEEFKLLLRDTLEADDSAFPFGRCLFCHFIMRETVGAVTNSLWDSEGEIDLISMEGHSDGGCIQ